MSLKRTPLQRLVPWSAGIFYVGCPFEAPATGEYCFHKAPLHSNRFTEGAGVNRTPDPMRFYFYGYWILGSGKGVMSDSPLLKASIIAEKLDQGATASAFSPEINMTP